MVDFELGPECRPELFEVYLDILDPMGPGPRARGAQGPGGPRGGQEGPRKDPKTDLKKFRSTFRAELKIHNFRVKNEPQIEFVHTNM